MAIFKAGKSYQYPIFCGESKFRSERIRLHQPLTCPQIFHTIHPDKNPSDEILFSSILGHGQRARVLASQTRNAAHRSGAGKSGTPQTSSSACHFGNGGKGRNPKPGSRALPRPCLQIQCVLVCCRTTAQATTRSAIAIPPPWLIKNMGSVDAGRKTFPG